MLPTVLDAAVVLLAFFIYKAIQRSRALLPPGPRPFLGFLALPSGTDKEWHTYGKWAEQWGDLTSVTVFGQPVVVINSIEVASEMLDKKSSIYSDRPVFQMCGELVGWKWGTAFLSYAAPQFKRARKYFHQLFGTHTTLSQFYPVTVDEYRKFLRCLLDSPERFLSHIHHTTSAVVLRITYGYTVQPENDPIVAMVTSVMDEFSVSSAPGAFMVDLLPILKYVPAWVPGAGFQRKAKTWANHLIEMIERPFKLVVDELAQGTAEDSFVSVLLRADLPAEEIIDAKWAAGTIYGGGAHTTASAISIFFLAMTRYPDVQAKAQAEIAAVLGSRRLPTFADRVNLPYVDALCKEVLRYHPVSPMGKFTSFEMIIFSWTAGVPHRLMEDDTHDGFFIPKGSIVLANIWSMTHNPEVYANPMVFDPSRFIASNHSTAEPDPGDFVFGFGRRVCPGKLLGDASLFMACAMVLATFTISKTIEEGVPVEPVEDYQPGIISQPAAFKCTIKPRAEAVALISEEFAASS